MSKQHDYEFEAPRCVDCGSSIEAPLGYEARAEAMLARCLESIGDLLQEAANGAAVLSIQQRDEMENIIKDARVQGLLT